MLLYPFLGQDFFPSVDAGQFKIHMRTRTGTRIEETARLCDEVDQTIREVIPKRELVTIIDNIGLPYSGINTTYNNSGTIGPSDADIQVSLSEDHHPTEAYVQKLAYHAGAPLSRSPLLRAAGRHGDADSRISAFPRPLTYRS